MRLPTPTHALLTKGTNWNAILFWVSIGLPCC